MSLAEDSSAFVGILRKALPMRCIYCLRDSTKSRSIPHCLPEALLRNGPALSIGAICDACNHYAGTNLEAILVEHPAIAFPLQLLGVPGKNGKPRAKLGVFERGIEEDAAVTFAIPTPEISLGPDGVTRAEFEIGLDPGFNMMQFRRALYHAAFNLAA